MEVKGLITFLNSILDFRSLPDNTVFLLLRSGERWCPAGVDVIRKGKASTYVPYFGWWVGGSES